LRERQELAGGLEVHTLLAVVACAQEAPLFAEARAKTGVDADLSFVNIRKGAGGRAAGPRPRPRKFISVAQSTTPLT
jgi:hypothetical protein